MRSVMGADYDARADLSTHMDAKRNAKAEADRQADERRAKAEAKLREDAAAGDTFAQLKVAMAEGNTVRYWALRKQFYLEECARQGIAPSAYAFVVGGISVLDPQFEELVAAL